MAKKLVIFFSIAAVALPIGIHIINASWSKSSLIQSLFPIFGLLAASLLWLHAISGVWEERLRGLIDFDKFVSTTATIILVSILLHPLLLLILIKFNFATLFMGGWPIRLGVIGLFLLLIYDVAKPFRESGYINRHWDKILIISNVGFLLTFLHSLTIGGDLQSGFLRYLWMFYGITGTLAIIYTYGIKKLLK